MYVDDFLAVVDADKIQETLNVLTGFDPKIQFTTEMEVDRSWPFLDMRIHVVESGRLMTEWYAKPYVSGRILNFFTKHPIAQKISTAA